MVALIHVGAFLFFFFLRPDLSPWRYGNMCFQVALCVPTVISGGVDIFEVPGCHLF